VTVKTKQRALWTFVAERLRHSQRVVLLVVAESHGSSPGRAGYKMAIAQDGSLVGSIGGGLMEVNLVEDARALLGEGGGDLAPALIEQEHRKNSDHPSGMICSGRQTVLRLLIDPGDLPIVEIAGDDAWLRIEDRTWGIYRADVELNQLITFDRPSEIEFTYTEKLGPKNELIIIGGGHCALALSEPMSRMDFSIRIFDDRPELNTLEKNEFADSISIVEAYDAIGDHVSDGDNVYVVVMTLGYRTDEIVIRKLVGRKFKYFGVLGSKAKMATLMRELQDEGFPPEQLDAIHTPIGLPINSHTPEEIAVSIAAEIISVKNA
jgi:xanthine dehydrogenase accessory factor